MSYIEGYDPNSLETSVESALGFYIPLIPRSKLRGIVRLNLLINNKLLTIFTL
jgi:hypothetical protein